MTPEELERQLAAATAAIESPVSAWSSIVKRGRVRRHRRAAAMTAMALAVPVAASVVFIAGGTTRHDDGHPGSLGTVAPTASPTLPPAPTPTSSPGVDPLEGAPATLVAVRAGVLDLYARTGHKLTAVRRLSAAGQKVDWVTLTPAREGAVYTVSSGCSSTVWTVKLDGSQRHKILESLHAKVVQPVLSPDGQLIAYGSDPCTSQPGNSPPEPSMSVRVDRLETSRNLWVSTDQADSVDGVGWQKTGLLLTYSLGYCCTATVEVHHVSLDAGTPLDTKIDPPLGCDWSYGETDAYVARCDDGNGNYPQRIGLSTTEEGRSVLAQEATYFEVLQARPSEQAHHVLLVAASFERKGSALVAADVENPSSTVLLMTGVTSADW